jgi:hypothetical protein
MKFVSLLLLLPGAVLAGKPIRNISVTLRGKKFDVDEATTVQDVLGKIKEEAGVDGRLLFAGRQLGASDSLEDMGVKEGDSLQMVPGTSTTVTKKKKAKSSAATIDATGDVAKTPTKPAGAMPDMSELLKNAGGMPNMEESIDMMTSMMSSPLFTEYMNDPEKLEASRQMILSNPLMKQMMASMPGMQEILEDKDAWREAMTAAAQLYKEMDPEQLKQAMMGNMPNAGDLGGLFGASPGAESAPTALDELSEDDEE